MNMWCWKSNARGYEESRTDVHSWNHRRDSILFGHNTEDSFSTDQQQKPRCMNIAIKGAAKCLAKLPGRMCRGASKFLCKVNELVRKSNARPNDVSTTSYKSDSRIESETSEQAKVKQDQVTSETTAEAPSDPNIEMPRSTISVLPKLHSYSQPTQNSVAQQANVTVINNSEHVDVSPETGSVSRKETAIAENVTVPAPESANVVVADQAMQSDPDSTLHREAPPIRQLPIFEQTPVIEQGITSSINNISSSQFAHRDAAGRVEPTFVLNHVVSNTNNIDHAQATVPDAVELKSEMTRSLSASMVTQKHVAEQTIQGAAGTNSNGEVLHETDRAKDKGEHISSAFSSENTAVNASFHGTSSIFREFSLRIDESAQEESRVQQVDVLHIAYESEDVFTQEQIVEPILFAGASQLSPSLRQNSSGQLLKPKPIYLSPSDSYAWFEDAEPVSNASRVKRVRMCDK